jgi:DNA-directed RNA polymerase subunit RPC12/RpoP
MCGSKKCHKIYNKERYHKLKSSKTPKWKCQTCGAEKQLDFEPLHNHRKLKRIKCDACG